MVESVSSRPGRRVVLSKLRAAAPAVLPSLLLCDFGNLQRELGALEEARVEGLHLDVMDGHFVPNLTYGLPIVQAIRTLTTLPLDVHLMIDNPGDFIEHYYKAGADVMTIHAEAVADPRPVLGEIRRLGAAAGLAINPATPVATIRSCLEHCDLVLVMSVQPGFGGQAFDPIALDKLREVKRQVPRSVLIEVDGGVKNENIAACRRAGAELLVVGSAIFRSRDYARAVTSLAELALSV